MTLLLNSKKSLAYFLCLFLLSNTLISQKKYPSLLWEISGNGLSKPSYLYGTMHVSSKLAYHLSDSFFVALNNVNTIGLESNPDQWLKNMKEIGLLENFNNPNTSAYSDFYKSAFKLDIPNNDQYSGILANDPDIINNLLYRNNENQVEYEESTYIDLFIYKAGSKLNKKIVSLENFKTSLVMATKASAPDPNSEYDKSKNKVDYYKTQNDIKDAYRNGDLDLLDSLTQLTYTTKNFQKYLIDDRNVILAHHIDSVNKTGSLFSGIGAAHLPGKDGVIELLRKMGYTVRPIMNKTTKKGIKQKDVLEEMVKKLPATKQFATDSLFSFDLFDALVPLANLKGFSFSLATDMTNGAYYTVSRQVTYAPLYNYTVEKMAAKMDSLFYESIPGKIVLKKEITSNTGIKGFDITNKTKKGDLQRYHIYILDNELIVFKMSGKGNYINSTDAIRFFNSIKFNPEKKGGQMAYTPPTKGFSVLIPSSYKYTTNKKSGLQGLAEDLFSYNPTTKTDYGVMHYFYHDFNYLEEDTFELNVLCNSTLKNLDFTSEQTRTLGKEQNLSCINFSGANTALNKTLFAKIFIKGVHYYLVYAITDNTVSNKKPEDFFNSFKLTDFNHVNELKTITDDDFAFTVTDEMVPEDRNQLQEALVDFYADIQKQIDNKKHSRDFEYNSKEKSYYSPSSGEHVNIIYEKFNAYDYRDPATFWSDVKKNMTSGNSLILTNPVFTKTNGTEILDVTLKDTACSSVIKRKIILKDGLLFSLSAICDSSIGMTGWTDSFMKTFRHKDTSFTKPIFENKITLLLKDLSSGDSSIKYAAIQSLNSISMDKSYAKPMIDYLKSDAFFKLDEESRAVLLVNGGTLNDEKIIPIYKNLYNHYEDSSYMQICLIKGLCFLKTKNSYQTIFELLKNKTPLTGSEEYITDIITPMYDSLELCKDFFPGLFSLSSFEEYKNPIYRLFCDLVIHEIVPSSQYATQVTMLLNEGNNELKRYHISANKTGKYAQSNYDNMETEIANDIARYYSDSFTEKESSTGKKTYPSYTSMVENFASTLAPFYATNASIKAYYDKLFKLKNEQMLLSITLIALKHKIPVNDTLWSYFSNNPKTKLKLFSELKRMKQPDKFDRSKLSQEEFCKTKIETEIVLNEYNNDYENASLKEKTKSDSIYFLRKEVAKNKTQDGFLYFFSRVDSKTKVKSLAYSFVNTSKTQEITTLIEVLETKKVIDFNKTMDETIKDIQAEFYYKGRKKYVFENGSSFDMPYTE